MWRYCQLSCKYCVSGSHLPQWTFTGHFKTFAPPGDERLNDLQLRAKWGPDYYKRMCPDKSKFLNAAHVLNFEALLKWIGTYAPGCQLHISGGEPLLRPDIESQLEKLCWAGIPVTVFTNGLLIDQRPNLFKMPLKWVVTHHTGAPFKKWRDNVELIRHRPYFVCRVLATEHEKVNKEEIQKQYSGLNFYWQRLNCTREIPGRNYDPDDLAHVASKVIHLVEADGRVYACNKATRPPIGNILDLSYNPETARQYDRQAATCAKSGLCGAYQSAFMLFRA